MNHSSNHSSSPGLTIWTALGILPRKIMQGAAHPPSTNGPAAAALLSPGIGAVLMMISHHLSDVNQEFGAWLWNLGTWIPGAKTGDQIYGEIGPYSGKATVILVGWLMSWFFLHLLLRRQSVSPRILLTSLIFLFMTATVMAWHPFFPYLPLMPK